MIFKIADKLKPKSIELPDFDHPIELADSKISRGLGVSSVETRNGQFLQISTSASSGNFRTLSNSADIAQSLGSQLVNPGRPEAEAAELLKRMAETTTAPKFIPIDIGDAELKKHGMARVLQAALNIRVAVNDRLELPTDVAVAVEGIVVGITAGTTLSTLSTKVALERHKLMEYKIVSADFTQSRMSKVA